jgi:AP endonuclease-1
MSNNIIFAHPRYRLGTHVPVEKTIYDTLYTSIHHGMSAIQFFLGSPQSFQRRTITDEDAKKVNELLDHFPTHLFSHAPYVFNLAGSVQHLAWDGNREIDQRVETAVNAISDELHNMAKIRGGVVLHPGNFADKKKGCRAIAHSISMIDFKEGEFLLLENMAGQGNVIGSVLQELRDIYDHVDPNKQQYVYFCIDTAHIWGKGIYKIDTEEGVKTLWNDIDEILLGRVRLVHLNDSKVKCGACVDLHDLIGEGEIWSEKESKRALYRIMEECSKREIPMVMETHPSDMYKFMF